MRLSGINATQAVAIREHFTNYPDEMTGPGVIAFAAANGYSVADVGSAFGSDAISTAAFAGITVEQANLPASQISAAQAAAAQRELISNDIRLWSGQHPNATSAQVREFLAYTDYTLNDIAIAGGITLADAQARMDILDQQAAAIEHAAATAYTPPTAAQNIATAQATYAAGLKAGGTTPGAIQAIVDTTGQSSSNVVPITAKIDPGRADKNKIIYAWATAHPVTNADEIRAFMTDSNITLHDLAIAGGISDTEAQRRLDALTPGEKVSTVISPAAPNWFAWITGAAALISIFK